MLPSRSFSSLVAEEVGAFLGEAELHLAGGRTRLAAGAEQRLVAGGHLRAPG